MKEYKSELEKPPYRIAKLPVHRGYPVPWFVAWMDNGEPEFRTMDGRKLRLAVTDKLCWVCGEKLGKNMTFVIGPMCAVNRVSAEPPSHLDCAEYSARNCPFLSKPQMVRRENDLPDDIMDPGGFSIKRNPGVTLVWTTTSFKPIAAPNGMIFRIGEAEKTSWYREGRLATRAEVEESTMSGLPILLSQCHGESDAAELGRMLEVAKALWPAA